MAEDEHPTLRESRGLLAVYAAMDSLFLTLAEKQQVVAALCRIYGAETPAFPGLGEHLGWRCDNCGHWVEPDQVTDICRLCGGHFSFVYPEEAGEQYMTEQELARTDAQRGMGRRHPRKQKEIE